MLQRRFDPTKILSALIYLRVSSSQQNVLGLERQRDKIEATLRSGRRFHPTLPLLVVLYLRLSSDDQNPGSPQQ